MLSSLLADTYRRYKQDADAIATWLASTRKEWRLFSQFIQQKTRKEHW
jgi:hypothetical protein